MNYEISFSLESISGVGGFPSESKNEKDSTEKGSRKSMLKIQIGSKGGKLFFTQYPQLTTRDVFVYQFLKKIKGNKTESSRFQSGGMFSPPLPPWIRHCSFFLQGEGGFQEVAKYSSTAGGSFHAT